MSPRTGRPPKGDKSRNVNLNIRVTIDEAELIKTCADKMKVTRTDAIMHGIRLVEAELNKKK